MFILDSTVLYCTLQLYIECAHDDGLYETDRAIHFHEPYYGEQNSKFKRFRDFISPHISQSMKAAR